MSRILRDGKIPTHRQLKNMIQLYTDLLALPGYEKMDPAHAKDLVQDIAEAKALLLLIGDDP